MTSRTGPQEAGKVVEAGGTIALALIALMLLCAPAARAACPAPAGSNAIVVENCRTDGVTPPSTWDIPGAGDDAIQGFATDISVNRGDDRQLQGRHAGDRLPPRHLPHGLVRRQRRPPGRHDPATRARRTSRACDVDATTTGLVDCGNWAVSDAWNVPADAASGIYFAHLVREDGTPGESHVVFVVRDDDGRSSLLFQTSDTTWQAYNHYGGNSLYSGGPGQGPSRAYKVSYNRPFTYTRGRRRRGLGLQRRVPDGPLARARTATTSATSRASTPTAAAPSIREHRMFLSVGHDEYWSGGAAGERRGGARRRREPRRSSAATRSSGRRGGRTTTARSSPTRRRTRTRRSTRRRCLDRDVARPARSAPMAASPRTRSSGTIFMVNSRHGADRGARRRRARCASGAAPRVATPACRRDRDARATARSATSGTRTSTTARGRPASSACRPPRSTASSACRTTARVRGRATATHHLTLYPRAERRAGLRRRHRPVVVGPRRPARPRERTRRTARMQQATVNLFADMGVQPASLQAGLAPATASTDTARRRHGDLARAGRGSGRGGRP